MTSFLLARRCPILLSYLPLPQNHLFTNGEDKIRFPVNPLRQARLSQQLMDEIIDQKWPLMWEKHE